LRHILVVEEAHRLLKNVSTERRSEMLGNPKGKAVETFCNVIAEMRAYGQGVIVVEQIPTKLAPDVVKNTNTKIAHRLVSRDDQELMGNALGLSSEDVGYLGRLPVGRALANKGGMERPVEILIAGWLREPRIDHSTVRRHMDRFIVQESPMGLSDFARAVGQEGTAVALKLFNTLLVVQPNQVGRVIEESRTRLSLLYARRCLETTSHLETVDAFLQYRALEFVGHGLYRNGWVYPDRFVELFASVLAEQTEEALTAFHTAIAEHQGSRTAAAAAHRKISQAVLNAIARERSTEVSDKELARRCREHFILPERKVIGQVVCSARTYLEECSDA
jgi:hypothetical protein